MLVAVSWATGVYPFGEESFLSEDLKYQYIDFFAWYKRVLAGQASVMYTFGEALGSSTWGLFSYYLSSPFNLLIVFFAEDRLVDFVFLITALKLGCIEVAMTWYLRRRFGLGYIMAMAVSLGFVWSTWTATQLRNPMWLDSLILLPVALDGVYALVRSGAWKQLCFSVAIDVVVCWYMGYMTVVFLCLFVVFESVIAHVSSGGLSAEVVVNRLARFIAALMLALCLSSFTFVPTIAARLDSWGTSLAIASSIVFVLMLACSLVLFAKKIPGKACRVIARIGRLAGIVLCIALVVLVVLACSRCDMSAQVTCTFDELLCGFLPSGWVINRTPQLFCGTLLLVAAVAFFFCPSIKAAARIATGTLLVFLVLCVFLVPLQDIWCGFREPAGFYSRPALFTSFFIVWVAAWSLNVYGTRMKLFLEGHHISYRIPAAAVGFLLLAIMAVDLFCSAVSAWGQAYSDYDQEEYDAYIEAAAAQYDELVSYDSGVYRFDKTYGHAEFASANEGMVLGYNSLSTYSSTSNGDVIDFLSTLGYNHGGKNSVRYVSPLLLTDSLLGMKYVSSIEQHVGYVETPIVQEDVDASVYMNPYALSLGYGASASLSEADCLSANATPFEQQNAFASSVAGKDVEAYAPLGAEATESTGDSRTWSVEVPAGATAYVYLLPREASSNPPDYFMTIDDEEPFVENWYWHHGICEIPSRGDLDGQPRNHTVTITRRDGGELPGDIECIFATLDFDAVEQVTSGLAQHQLEITSFSDGYVEGSYSAYGDELLLLSIPVDPGWNITVNGERAEPLSVYGGALTALDVEGGENEIVMKYFTPGLVVGCAVSLLSLVCVLLYLRRGRRRAGFASRSSRRPYREPTRGARGTAEVLRRHPHGGTYRVRN